MMNVSNQSMNENYHILNSSSLSLPLRRLEILFEISALQIRVLYPKVSGRTHCVSRARE